MKTLSAAHVVDIGCAAEEIQRGASMTRLAWVADGVWIAIHPATKLSKMTRPFIYMKRADNHLVPWTPTHEDILACDWIKVIEE